MRTEVGNDLLNWFDQEIKLLESSMKEAAFSFTEKEEASSKASYQRYKHAAEKLIAARQKAVYAIGNLENKIAALTAKETQS